MTQPRMRLIAIEHSDDVTRSTWAPDRNPGFPTAPATLRNDQAQSVFELHRLVDRRGSIFTFETYAGFEHGVVMGQSYEYTGWWLPAAFDALVDATVEWVRATYPDDGSDHLCLFTWDRIAAYAENKEGYVSQYGWITVRAYEEFIVADRLRVRRFGSIECSYSSLQRRRP